MGTGWKVAGALGNIGKIIVGLLWQGIGSYLSQFLPIDLLIAFMFAVVFWAPGMTMIWEGGRDLFRRQPQPPASGAPLAA